MFAVKDNEIPGLIAQHFHQASVGVAHKAAEYCVTRFEFGFCRIGSQRSPFLSKRLNRSSLIDHCLCLHRVLNLSEKLQLLRQRAAQIGSGDRGLITDIARAAIAG